VFNESVYRLGSDHCVYSISTLVFISLVKANAVITYNSPSPGQSSLL
jgi:hypothetical protein